MKIRFIWVGKTKLSYLTAGIEDYKKRLSHYCKADYLELKDASPKNKGNPKKAERPLFAQHMNKSAYTICLDENGRQMSSRELANFLSELQNRSIKNVNLMIGGAFGWSPDILRNSNFQLSLSRMTLPHDLCRLVLLEQVYRAFTIIKGEKYHNP